MTSLNYVTITGTFDDGSGTPLSGTVVFTPSATVYAAGVPVASASNPVTVSVTSGALGSVHLLATDNSGLAYESLTGFFYWTVQITLGGLAQQGWSFFLPSSPSTVDLYTLANSAAGGGFANPMTTLGDMIAENATPAAARLAGTTSAAKHFLTQTGTGSVSALPSWGTIAAGDVPGVDGVTVSGTPAAGQVLTATSSSAADWQPSGVQQVTFTYGSTGAVPSSGTYTAGMAAVDQDDIMRVCTVGGTPGTWARVGQTPEQFYADDYGAKGDGRVFTAGSGSNGSPTFNDTTNSPFASGDTGKLIVVNQGASGGNTNPFAGTLTFVSASQVTLNANLGAAASGAPYAYGTDDTAAINNCVLAAYNWFVASSRKVQIMFSGRIYMLGTFIQDTALSWPGNGGLTGKYNCHIPLPVPSETGPKFQIEMIGTGFAPATEFWESLTPQLASGTVLLSTGTTNRFQPDSTYGQASIIQSSNDGSSSGLTNFMNAMLVMDGISLVVPWNSPTSGVEVLYYGQAGFPSVRCCAFAPVNFAENAAVGGPNLAQSNRSTNSNSGIAFPVFLNNAFSYVGWAIVEGFGIGINAAEHFAAEYVFVDYGNIAFQVNGPSASPATHGITVQHLGVEQCNYAFYVFNGDGAGFGNGTCPVFVGLLDMEDISTDHVYDPNDNLVGTIYWNDLTATHPVVAGGQNLIVINTTRVQPGPWAGAPSSPSSGTASAQQNLAYRYATIYASSTGSISAAFTGQGTASMTSLGLTAGPGAIAPVRVNPGAWYALTYSGTASTTWVLD